MKENYGPWAFIAGGSEGVGAEIGATLAAQGINICLVARNEAALRRQQQQLQNIYKVNVIAEVVDLSHCDAVEKIISLTHSLDVGFYAYVASYAPLDSYLDASPERHHRSLRINVSHLHDLTYHFATKMKQRGSGGIMLCSSMASLNPFPNNAQYAAQKAYIRMLGEALWYELKAFKVDVLTLIMGEVSTPALLRSGSELQGEGKTLTPSQVVKEAFSLIGKKPSFITGRRNRFAMFIAHHFLPKKLMMKFMAREITKYKEPPEAR